MNSRFSLAPPTELDDEERRVFALLAFEFEGDDRPLVPGMSIDDFVLEGEIGRGGSGIVFAAKQSSLGRRVALKFTASPPHAADPARIEREARLLAEVRHEAIVAVHAAGFFAGFRYVAMDLVEGSNLRRWLRGELPDFPTPGSPAALPFVIEMLARIAGALAAAHRLNVVHRDVKPENVLLDRVGRAFLADFGLARRDDLDDTVTRGFVGTLRYASPEQIRGDVTGLASDVFSFGATAFEMLTGRPAFPGSSGPEVGRAITLRDPAWTAGAASRDLRAIVEKCLEKDPARRYADGSALLADLERLRRFERVLAVARGPFGRLLRRATRRPVAVGVTLILIGAMIAIGWLLRSLDVGERTLEAEVARGRWTEALAAIADGDVPAATNELESLLDDPSLGDVAAGRLADLQRIAGESRAAIPNYERALQGEESAIADRLGLWLAKQDSAIESAPPPRLEPDRCLDTRDLAATAAVLRRSNRMTDALALLDRALTADPTAFFERIARAEVQERLGRYETALDDYRVAREIRPKDVRVLDRVARLLMLVGRSDEAESSLRTASVALPPAARLIECLALSVAFQGRQEESVAIADDGLRRFPAQRGLLRARAIALSQLKKIVEAKASIAPEFAADPDDPWLIDARAAIAYQENDFATLAEMGCRLAIDADWPWNVDGRGHWARALTKLGAVDGALELYDGLVAGYPFDPRWHQRRGQLLTDLGRFEDALADVERSVELSPRDVRALYLKGRVERSTGRIEEALHTYERALALEPGRAETHYWMADVWFTLGEPRAAQRYASTAYLAHPTWNEAWVLGALCCFHQGDMVGALLHYDRVLANHPSEDIELRVRADRAETLHLLGRDQESLHEYLAVREELPDLATTFTGEGILRLESRDPSLHDPRAALCLFEHAIELEPGDTEFRALLARAQRAATVERAPIGVVIEDPSPEPPIAK